MRTRSLPVSSKQLPAAANIICCTSCAEAAALIWNRTQFKCLSCCASMHTAGILLFTCLISWEVVASPSRSLHRSLGKVAALATAASTASEVLHGSYHQGQHPPAVLQQGGCAQGCELNGNCNRALRVCECPVGYIGPNCSQPLWPACKVAPQQQELYCSAGLRPKSCECLEQCAAFVCPGGTVTSCERDFDFATAKCFQRPAGATITTEGVLWDGGSDFPEDTEPGVKYYKEYLDKNHKQEIIRDEIIDVGVVDTIDDNPLVALPLSSCPLRCTNQGSCVRRQNDVRPFCACHYGFTGEFCEQLAEQADRQNVCWNNCQGRGRCRRGFCHCQPGWWGKDCSSSEEHPPHSSRRTVHKLLVYVYDLPWTVAYQPDYDLGFRAHDANYMAWQVFGEMFMNDTAIRTQNPWEANMFYIPAMTYAFSINTGNTVLHSRRAIDYVRQQWPFFNRSQGLDHFLWVTHDRGACDWPAEEDPGLANVIKVVHFGWHHVSGKAGVLKGWEVQLKNKHWGCFNPLRDISAAPYWRQQGDTAQATYAAYDASQIPRGRLLFFAGSVRLDDVGYSQGVRQQLWRMFGDGHNPQVVIHDGRMPPEQHAAMANSSRFCLAPSGYGWGIRLSQYMASGCVPVIIQDDIYQPWEDQLPYYEFSVRLPRSSITDIVPLLSAIQDEDYRQLRSGMAKYWRAFVWDRSAGGQAYDFMVKSLRDRMFRLQARHYHPLHSRPSHNKTAGMDSVLRQDGTAQHGTTTDHEHGAAAWYAGLEAG